MRVFTVVGDGGRWRWRVTWPNSGRCSATSNESFATRADAERAAHRVADCERPSFMWVGNYPGHGYPAEKREDWVGA